MTPDAPAVSPIPAGRPPRRRLAAVMFADMVDYSRQIEQDERRNSLQVSKSVDLFKTLVGDYGGDVANVAGDGILAIFDSAEQAVLFAVQVQSDFRNQAVWSNGKPIQFRIGINVGEVMQGVENIQGHCVNVAARLQQFAEPGSIVISSAVRDSVREQLRNVAALPRTAGAQEHRGSDRGLFGQPDRG